MDIIDKLLPKVKLNLILQHNDDDELLKIYIQAAVNYGEEYQKRKFHKRLPAVTEQAIIMLSSHFYESRDGSTAGFFADSAVASNNVWSVVNRLLILGRDWSKSV
jgi:uncharacterized phage protein (predicted DNA packaging)